MKRARSLMDIDDSDGLSEVEDMKFLESQSITANQRHQYQTYMRKFKDFCKEQKQGWPPEFLDSVRADYCVDLFLAGQSASTGEKTVAAVEFFMLGWKGKLVKSKRSLKGWRRLCPPSSRLPLPRLVSDAIAVILKSKGEHAMAVKVAADFDMYLRPSEGQDILGRHVVAPMREAGKHFINYAVIIRDEELGKPDKTGVFDNTLHLDNPTTSTWLGPAMMRLAKKSGPDHPIYDFKMGDFRKQLQRAGEQLGLPNLHAYQLRHGGASDDLNQRRRDFNAVRERGRWRTDSSVRRYAKTGKIQKMLQDMKSTHLEFCKWASKNLERVMTGRIAAREP